jgi:acetyl-CoA C-acetyltransferase
MTPPGPTSSGPTSQRAVVVAARRTPVATAGRGLAGLGPAELASPVLAALRLDLARAIGGPPPRLDDVVLGNCRGPGGNVARVAALAAGLGEQVPGVTLDRQCGSGLEAVRLGAALIAAGEVDFVLAGGVESASTAPGGPGHRARFTPVGHPDPEMGAAADAAADARGIGRERQDAYAARSHARTVAAHTAGVDDPELVALAGCVSDDRPRPGLDAATLGRFRPAFSAHGTVTAGNACGISDGAAAVALVSERWWTASGMPGLRVLASVAVGADPALPALAAAPAVQAVLGRVGLDLDDVAVFEVTEAFAAQLLACTDELGLDPFGADAERVCPDGGAIALGHPWSASGAMLVVRLFSRLVRRGSPPGTGPGPGPGPGRYGVAACAIGGGQGLAVLFERVG